MIRVIEIKNGREIVKHTDRKNNILGYGVRDKGATNKPFEVYCDTLGEARTEAGIPYSPPAKDTPKKGDYSQFTGTSRKGGKGR